MNKYPKNSGNYNSEYNMALPELKEHECGEIALQKMKPFIPRELDPYIIHNEDEIREKLFVPKEIMQPPETSTLYKSLVICRVSTCGDTQDPRSPINQALSVLENQKRRSDFQVVGVIMDFFKNGAAAEGRMFQDYFIRDLKLTPYNGLTISFNSIVITEFSRLVRSVEETIKLAKICRFYKIKLLDYYLNINYADPVNYPLLVLNALKAENEISEMGFRIARSNQAAFLRDRVLLKEHFGFRIGKKYDPVYKKRILYRYWIPVEEEIQIIKSIYKIFIETASIKAVQEGIFELYNKKLSTAWISQKLNTLKYFGIVYRIPTEKFRNPVTNKVTSRPIIVASCSDNSKINVHFALTVLVGKGACAKSKIRVATQYNWRLLTASEAFLKNYESKELKNMSSLPILISENIITGEEYVIWGS